MADFRVAEWSVFVVPENCLNLFKEWLCEEGEGRWQILRHFVIIDLGASNSIYQFSINYQQGENLKAKFRSLLAYHQPRLSEFEGICDNFCDGLIDLGQSIAQKLETIFV